MTLNASGAISLGGSVTGQSVNLQLGQGAATQVSMNDTNVRTLAGIASGAIDFNSFHGKPSFIGGTYTYTANGTFTLPSGYSTAVVEIWGGGGGGGSGLTPNTAGTAGTATTFSGTGVSLTANGGGLGGQTTSVGAGGTASGGTTNTSGTVSYTHLTLPTKRIV